MQKKKSSKATLSPEFQQLYATGQLLGSDIQKHLNGWPLYGDKLKQEQLYRRANTSLHFDLSIHNVPEYKNVTQLRALLRQRLEAMTGRVLKRSADLD
jgi:hypothetical protein